MPTKCTYENCTKDAIYGLPGAKKKRTRCAKHKEPGMINRKKDNRVCIHDDHKGSDRVPRSSFNFPGEKRGIYCKAHAEKGMVNVNVKNFCKKCKIKQPSYGLPGKKATHCAKCSEPNMIDVISNLCNHQSCRKNATFGYPDEKAQWCKTHATQDMIDVKNKRCIVCIEQKVPSPKQPSYGVDNVSTHCKEHKLDGMVNIRHKNDKCECCGKRPTYGYDKPIRCVSHKENDMKDVVSSMCSKCGDTQGVFGHDKTELYCRECSTDDMRNVKARMCCVCGEHQPTFNYKGDRPMFCNSCKLIDMIDVVNPRCSSCKIYIVGNKYTLCSFCNPLSYIKTRETKVVNFLNEAGLDFEYNKSIGYVCGNYRPDIMIDSFDHVVIVEVDEYQHRRYEEFCEITRMLNIHNALKKRCIFLRYNPDTFRKGRKIIKVDDDTRLNLLLDEIVKHMMIDPEEEITVYRLFYNNPSGEYVQKYNIDVKRLNTIAKLSNQTPI